MKMTVNVLVSLVLSLALSGGTLADVLVNNAPYLDENFGQQSDGNTPAYFQTFAAPANSTFEAIRWWGYHSGDSSGSDFDNFVVSFDGIAQTGTLSIVQAQGAIFEYTLNITQPVTATFTSLSIVNNSTDVEWRWQSSVAQGSSGPDASAVALTLLGQMPSISAPVPEPSSVVMLLAGLVTVGLRASRRRKTESPA